MTFDYRPILRWKRGERVGLSKTSVVGRKHVVPLFVLGMNQLKGRKATKSKPALSPSASLVSDLKAVWGSGTVCVDASAYAVPPGTRHPIQLICSNAAKAGVSVVPATTLNAPNPYQAAVAAVVKTDGKGVCLRVDLQEMTLAPSWISAWPFEPSETDLIVDFQDDVEAAAGLGKSLDHAFKTLHVSTEWRSVTVAGTSMPPNFAGMLAGQHLIKRREWEIWERLQSLALPYDVHYGDYTTVPTSSPPPGIAWGFPINVRYTLEKHFLICRGVKTTGRGAIDMDVQLIGHAKAIATHPKRGALAHCWADTTIDKIAAGKAATQGLEHWVQLGVNRHVELIRSILP